MNTLCILKSLLSPPSFLSTADSNYHLLQCLEVYLLRLSCLTPSNKDRKKRTTKDKDTLLSSHSYALTHLAKA